MPTNPRSDPSRPRRPRVLPLLAPVLVVLLLGSACGDDGDGDAAADKATTSTAASGDAGSSTTEPADVGPAEVGVSSTDLGEVLADDEGYTLYLFTPDGTGDSTCVDSCAEAWPPLVTAEGPLAAGGADQSLIGTIERADGGLQVTYGGHPLYTYGADPAPGDTNGQGVDDQWYAVDVTGEAVTTGADGTDGRY